MAENELERGNEHKSKLMPLAKTIGPQEAFLVESHKSHLIFMRNLAIARVSAYYMK